MSKFLFKIFGFGLLLLLIVIIGSILPVTPRTSKSLLYAQIQKDSLLENVKKSRIIFVGGSNLSFGLNSQLIKDSLLLNPINTAIYGKIGLQYMIDNVLPKIQEGDIVVVAPEYAHFYGNFIYGGEELLRTVIDINISQLFELKIEQIKNIYPYMLKYSFSKFKPTEYFGYSENNIYSVNSFNKYGDASAHWSLGKRNFASFKTISDSLNYNTFKILLKAKKDVEQRKANFYLTFPGFQASSFDNNVSQIDKVYKELRSNNFDLLGTPERYRMPESLMFNTPYHLIKEGVDYRTQLLIEDIKKELLTSSRLKISEAYGQSQ